MTDLICFQTQMKKYKIVLFQPPTLGVRQRGFQKQTQISGRKIFLISHTFRTNSCNNKKIFQSKLPLITSLPHLSPFNRFHVAAEGREGGGGTSCKYVAKELFTPRKCQKLTVNMQQLLTVYFNFLSSLLKLLAHSFSAR